MPLPKLLQKSSLIPNTKKEKLDDFIPIDYIIGKIRERINNVGIKNKIIILKSSTGSGKSTILGVYLYNNFYKKGEGNIVFTQPRVMNAITIVRDQIAGSGLYPNMKLGENIGWQTGPSRKMPRAGLIYMTIGIIVEHLKTMSDEQFMSRYKIIVIDEVHEATLEQALLLFMLKGFYLRNQNNPKLPFLILTSATFDTEKFLKYFQIYEEPNNPALIQVSGFAYPLEERWTMEKSIDNYVRAIANLAVKIHIENKNDEPENRDILIFLPSMTEITEMTKLFSSVQETFLKKENSSLFAVLQIDSEAVRKDKKDFIELTDDIKNVKYKGRAVSRRIILSTSVAETGVTIDTLKYIIDSGFHRGPQYNANYRISGILTVPCPKSRIKQRMGRANRKSPGVYYPMYPKYVYEGLPDSQLADIQTSDVSDIILPLLLEQTKQDKSKISSEFDMLDKPPHDSTHVCFEKLYALGFISPNSIYEYTSASEPYIVDFMDKINSEPGAPHFGFTRIGAIASHISIIPPESIRMIFASYEWGVSTLDMITIAAFLTFDLKSFKRNMQRDIGWSRIYANAFKTVKFADSTYYQMRLLIADNFIDGLIMFKAVSRVINEASNLITSLQQFCDLADISYTTIIEMLKVRDSIINNFIALGLNPFYGVSIFDNETSPLNMIISMKYCIYEGYMLNIATYNGKEYVSTEGLAIQTPSLFSKDEEVISIERKYGIEHLNLPKYILYDALKFKAPSRSGNMSAYSVTTTRISSLDGYVHNDLHFNS